MILHRYFQMIKSILILFLYFQIGSSYPDGAPERVCNSMMPYHDVTPQQCHSKYVIQSNKPDFETNDIIQSTSCFRKKKKETIFSFVFMLVDVRGVSTNDYFKGILLVAFNENNRQIVGSWSLKNSSVKTISCNEKANTAVTHTSPDDKFAIQAYWHAPPVVANENIAIK